MNDVEDFLRRVAQMRAEAQAKAKQQQRPQPQRPQQTPPQQPGDRSSPPPVRQQQPAPRVVSRPPIPEAEIVEAEIAQRDDLIDRGVREHMRGTDEIARHTRSLGADVDRADDKLEARLHQVFDHQLGDLKQSGAQAPVVREQVTPDGLSPDAIWRLLKSPTAARDAVIMAEILQRPEHRW